KDTVLDVVRGIVWILSQWGYTEQVESITSAAVKRFPALREPLRRALGRHIAMIEWANEHDAGPPRDLPEVIRRVHDSLTDPSLEGRLRQHVGPNAWDKSRDADAIRQLAVEITSRPEVLLEHLPWLASGQADSGFDFGVALGEADDHGQLLS